MHKYLKESIEIMAPASKVWEYFTNPKLSRALGGEYISEWKVGSEISWMSVEGEIYTKGKILEIEPSCFLKHTLVDMESPDQVLLINTYTFEEFDEITLLTGKAEFKKPIEDKEYEDAVAGWKDIFGAIKEIVEL
ncbi:MAG: SRPBCC domain-containing protein [Candidatus Gracilibacteria bacterium]